MNRPRKIPIIKEGRKDNPPMKLAKNAQRMAVIIVAMMYFLKLMSLPVLSRRCLSSAGLGINRSKRDTSFFVKSCFLACSFASVLSLPCRILIVLSRFPIILLFWPIMPDAAARVASMIKTQAKIPMVTMVGFVTSILFL